MPVGSGCHQVGRADTLQTAHSTRNTAKNTSRSTNIRNFTCEQLNDTVQSNAITEQLTVRRDSIKPRHMQWLNLNLNSVPNGLAQPSLTLITDRAVQFWTKDFRASVPTNSHCFIIIRAATKTEGFPCFSSVVRQITGYNSQRRGTTALPNFFLLCTFHSVYSVSLCCSV
jgi:hypothetical protein